MANIMMTLIANDKTMAQRLTKLKMISMYQKTVESLLMTEKKNNSKHHAMIDHPCV